MTLGGYTGVSFTVSDRHILTLNGLKEQGGSEWVAHNQTGARARSQWTAPKLWKYSYDLLFRAQDGVNPRDTLRRLQRAAGQDVANWFIIGGSPLSPYPFKITNTSGEWAAVLHRVAMVECKMTPTIEEHLQEGYCAQHEKCCDRDTVRQGGRQHGAGGMSKPTSAIWNCGRGADA